MTDFETMVAMLQRANRTFTVGTIEGEGNEILIPSDSSYYDTGVCMSFNLEGALEFIHSYEPEPEEDE